MADTPSDNKIEFLAYLPPIQTALTVSGDGDLLRIKMDCNLKVSPDAVRLLTMTGKRLKITVEELLTEHNYEKTQEETKRSPTGMDRRRINVRRDKR